MIILLAIILFIIFLIYSIKPKREEYTLDGIKLSWDNKGSIEGVVTKWVVTLKDSSGNVIHTYENSEPKNLKDFTAASMDIVNNKEFNKSIIGNNILELYYNEVKSENRVHTKPVAFTEEDFGDMLDTSKLNEIVPNLDCVGKYIKVKKDKTTEGEERFACGPNKYLDRYYCQFWKHKIENEKVGSGKACSRANNYVIETRWPTETTADERIGTPFQNDPNPNTDENVLNDPQHYKKIWENAPFKPVDCVGKYLKVKRNKTTEGAERFACGPEDDNDRHYCQFWKHKIETEKKGTGKACSRANNHVIKTQWPTETTASKRIGTSFQNDPNPNTNENVLNDPQHYKNIWDKATPLITEIPHQIPSAAPGGWCNHRNSVHQDVPGCGRICSDSNTVGRKDKGTWGSWNAYPGSVNCPAAKLDQVWKKEGNSRKLAFGKYSEVGPPPPPPPQPTASSKGIRYVWFGYEKSGWPERPLNIAEIEVYSGGVNIVKDFGDGKVQSSSIYANWTSPKNLFDGNKSSMAHTNDSGTNYFKIDLGKEYSAIDKVMVHNRDNCCYERWAGSFVKLLDKDGVEIMRSTDTLPIVANKNDSTNITKAKNYKEGGVRVKTFTFDHPARQAVATAATPTPPPPAAPANQDCEGSWVNDPTGRSNSWWNNNYKTMKWVETKKKIGNGKDCKWAFTRKNPHKGATDVSRNWAGYIKNSDDKWTSEIVTDGQKGEVFNHQNEYGFQMKNTNTNYLKYCMRHANVPLDKWGRYSKSMYANNAWLNTGAYGREKVWFTCDDED